MKNSECNKFTWGDIAIVKKEAPQKFRPGEIGSICSVLKISPEDVVKEPSLLEPSWLYTVEFGDGSSVEIPEYYLKRYPSSAT